MTQLQTYEQPRRRKVRRGPNGLQWARSSHISHFSRAELTPDDVDVYAGVERKLDLAKDAVIGVAEGFSTGLYLWGGGGTAKSYTVDQALRLQGVEFHIHNSITGRALIDVLRKYPDDIHVIEDIESLLKDSIGRRVLRSALWSQSKAKPMRRPVMHSTHKDDIRFIFRGGIIIVCNHNLGKSAIEQAIGTRIRVIHMDLSATELLVLMKTICADGYKFGRDQLSPQECWQVAEFIREEFSRLSRDLDIRLLINSFKDRLFWRSGVPKSHWKDLVRARIRKTVAVGYRSRREVTAEEAAIAMEIYSQAGLTLKQKIDAWNERTGKSQGAFYRALNRSRAK